MAALLQYPAVDVRIEGMEVDRPLPQSWLATILSDTEVEPDEKDGSLRGRLSRSGHDIVVRGRVRAAVSMPCARCLDPAHVEVDAELSLLLQPANRSELRRSSPGRSSAGRSSPGRSSPGRSSPGRSKAARSRPGRSSPGGGAGEEEEFEFSAVEADLDVYDGETVILDPFVREAILLEIPNFPLCREDCPGLLDHSPDRDEVATIDPRLAPLSAFRKKGEGPVTVEDLVAAAGERSTAMGRKPVLKTNQRRGKKKKK